MPAKSQQRSISYDEVMNLFVVAGANLCVRPLTNSDMSDLNQLKNSNRSRNET
jgi:hypothetical protein